jgi:hypothetical protein
MNRNMYSNILPAKLKVVFFVVLSVTNAIFTERWSIKDEETIETKENSGESKERRECNANLTISQQQFKPPPKKAANIQD